MPRLTRAWEKEEKGRNTRTPESLEIRHNRGHSLHPSPRKQGRRAPPKFTTARQVGANDDHATSNLGVDGCQHEDIDEQEEDNQEEHEEEEEEEDEEDDD